MISNLARCCFFPTSGIDSLVPALLTSCISLDEMACEEMFTNFNMAPSFFFNSFSLAFLFLLKEQPLSHTSFAGWNASKILKIYPIWPLYQLSTASQSLIYFVHSPRKYRTTSQSIKSCRYITELLCDVWHWDIITGNNDSHMQQSKYYFGSSNVSSVYKLGWTVVVVFFKVDAFNRITNKKFELR